MTRIALLVFLAAGAAAAAPTRILDTMSDGGSPVNATCILTWPSFRTADGTSVSSGARRYIVRAGLVDIALQPTLGATPTSAPWMAPAYFVRCGSVAEYWQVPTSSPTTLAAVRQGAPGPPAGGGGGGTGDVLGPSTSIDGEIAIYNGATGKTIKRGTQTGVLRATAGVVGVVPGAASDCVKVDGSSGACGSGGGGNVTGPGSSTAGNVPTFSNSSGTQLQDSGVSVAAGAITAPGGLVSGNGTDPGYVDLLAGTPSTNPGAGQRRLYVDSSGVWRAKDSAGASTPVGGAGGTGDVVGPSASVDGEIALYNATTGKLLKRATGSGVLKVTNGVAATVTGNASDCVKVDASSGACGGSSTAASWFVPFFTYSVYGGAPLINMSVSPSALAGRVGVDASVPVATTNFPADLLTGTAFLTAIPSSWNGTSALTVRLLKFDSSTATRRLSARVQCSMAAIPVDQEPGSAVTWGATETADLAGTTAVAEATITTSLSLAGCTAGGPVLIGIYRDGAAVAGGGDVRAFGARLSIP